MPNDTQPEDLIRYDVLVQDALLGVVRKVLTDASRNGLPGDHHFYVSFRSQAPGVRLSARLREKHPEIMTIVLQHQFWDLLVTDHALEVGLSFGGIPERVLVPFEAMTGFYDPSVQFGLKFASDEATPDQDLGHVEPAGSVKDRLDAIAEHEKSLLSPGSRGQTGQSKAIVPTEGAKPAASPVPAKLPAIAASSEASAKKPRQPKAKPAATAQDAATGSDPPPSAQVVSLEAFRKKK